MAVKSTLFSIIVNFAIKILGKDKYERYRQYLYFLSSLAERDIKARYRRSALGHVWVVLQPLLMMSIWLIMRSFFSIPSNGAPYVVFVYSGMVLWSYFSNIINNCAPSISSNAGIIKKIKVPREIFLLAAVTTATFDLIMSLGILGIVMAIYDVGFTPMLLMLPYFIIFTSILGLAVGMVISAIGIFKSDIIMATNFLLQIWMFLTPIVYPLTSVPEEWRRLYSFVNPMVGLIDGFKNIVVFAKLPDWSSLTSASLFTLILLYFAWPFFRRRAQYFADVM